MGQKMPERHGEAINQNESGEATGRIGRFKAPMNGEDDVEPCIRRLSQYLGGALRDGTVDSIDIIVYELASADDAISTEARRGRFQAPVATPRDVDSIGERIGQYLAAVSRDPGPNYAMVGVRELVNGD